MLLLKLFFFPPRCYTWSSSAAGFGFQHAEAALGVRRHLCRGCPCTQAGSGTARECTGIPWGSPPPRALGRGFSSLSLQGSQKEMQVPLYSFGERFGEAETDQKDQDFLARVRSLLRDVCHQQKCGRGLGPDCRVRLLV